jgi:hypothetical protein
VYASDDIAEVQGWVAEAIKSDRAVMLPNKDGSFKIEINMGRAVGTKGQNRMRIMINDQGSLPKEYHTGSRARDRTPSASTNNAVSQRFTGPWLVWAAE